MRRGKPAGSAASDCGTAGPLTQTGEDGAPTSDRLIPNQQIRTGCSSVCVQICDTVIKCNKLPVSERAGRKTKP